MYVHPPSRPTARWAIAATTGALPHRASAPANQDGDHDRWEAPVYPRPGTAGAPGLAGGRGAGRRWLATPAHTGITRRANSVWPNQTRHALSLADKLALVEAFYAARGLPTRYQLCPAAQPRDLDGVLEQRGYTADALTSVQVAWVGPVLAATADRAAPVDLTATLSPEWFATYCRAEAVDAGAAEQRHGILARIAPPTAYAVVRVAGRPVTTGLGVLEGGWVGVFSMATSTEEHRRGAAIVVLHALAAWGQQQEAQGLYLQVMHAKGPARRLYEHVGFTPWYEYHYRERRLAVP